MQKRPTLHDVAKEAGVSHMTVSRVLRQEGGVREETRAKVEEAIAKTGYRPDPALSALAAYRNQGSMQGEGSTLAFLDCDKSTFSQEVFEGVQTEARLHGYMTEIHKLPPSIVGQKKMNHVLFNRGVRGLLFGPSDDELEFRGWDWPNYASVSLGALQHRPVMHAVAMNYFDGAFSGCRMLQQQGCKRIGFAIEPKLEARTNHQWLGGYAAAMSCQKLRIYRGTWPAGPTFKRWVTREKLDGLLAIQAGLSDQLTSHKTTIVLLNDYDSKQLDRMTHLRLDRARLGAEGVRFLHHLLLRREYGIPEQPHTVALRGSWVIR
ncbi:LacI family DNA-binding transcriptional regulator [Rubellicoccus peritrichatus]|uniref:LacI family DNA-binding transcriptional regulator n=1 Tax=Rubellicoccus peritrichatus TaxID=3080537 RepID=A0AAQ3QVQ4_9BACT|nr:LacI family DNA-binding transcriptional regulator [Puniceicoccus sp. CR14]WOO41868.1 LacI family DNA-binding transcriptional regulator [Puniceicoccus sp. CR14]